MKKWQTEHIRVNLTMLIKNIEYNAILGSSLITQGVIGDIDVENVTCSGKRYDIASALLKCLETRTNGYRGLVIALREVGQTVALRILVDGLILHLAPEHESVRVKNTLKEISDSRLFTEGNWKIIEEFLQEPPPTHKNWVILIGESPPTSTDHEHSSSFQAETGIRANDAGNDEKDGALGENTSVPDESLKMHQDKLHQKPVTTITTAKKWCLDFKGVDVKNVVLQKVQHSLISKMPSEDINARIILQLGGLNVFEASECDQILHGVGEFCNQQKRMTQLFRIISTLSSSEIVLCFEKLCDLENLPKYSERFREVFQNAYPGSLTSC